MVRVTGVVWAVWARGAGGEGVPAAAPPAAVRDERLGELLATRMRCTIAATPGAVSSVVPSSA